MSGFGLDEIVDAAVNILVAEAVNYIIVGHHLLGVCKVSVKMSGILMRRDRLKNQMRIVKRGGGAHFYKKLLVEYKEGLV